MKLNKASETLGNVNSGTTFTMKATPEAFAILSKNLYSNPIRAVIRELTCNAIDSHVQAGKANEPIIVHLPNHVNNVFSVRDNGVGLSEEQVTEIYTQFFNSTKTNDNSMIGGFGLGSKTPFAITQAFKIISRFNGVETTYLASLQNGIPTLSKLFDVEVEECNGVEVQVNVKPEDVRSFIREAETVLCWYDVTPVNLDGEEIVDKCGYLEKVNKDGYSSIIQRKHHALIGGVVYPIDDEVAKQSIFEGAIIKFEVGELSIAPSREALSYDDATKAKIVERFNSISDSFIADMKKRVLTSDKPIAELSILKESLSENVKRLHLEPLIKELTDEIKFKYLVNVWNKRCLGILKGNTIKGNEWSTNFSDLLFSLNAYVFNERFNTKWVFLRDIPSGIIRIKREYKTKTFIILNDLEDNEYEQLSKLIDHKILTNNEFYEEFKIAKAERTKVEGIIMSHGSVVDYDKILNENKGMVFDGTADEGLVLSFTRLLKIRQYNIRGNQHLKCAKHGIKVMKQKDIVEYIDGVVQAYFKDSELNVLEQYRILKSYVGTLWLRVNDVDDFISRFKGEITLEEFCTLTSIRFGIAKRIDKYIEKKYELTDDEDIVNKYIHALEALGYTHQFNSEYKNMLIVKFVKVLRDADVFKTFPMLAFAGDSNQHKILLDQYIENVIGSI